MQKENGIFGEELHFLYSDSPPFAERKTAGKTPFASRAERRVRQPTNGHGIRLRGDSGYLSTDVNREFASRLNSEIFLPFKPSFRTRAVPSEKS